MTSAAPLLQVRDLTVRIDGSCVVNGVEFSLNPGQIVAIVGESGSGKSMTALSLLRLLPRGASIDRGEILLQDRDTALCRDVLRMDMRSLRRVRGGEIAMVFQEPMTSLNPVYSIGEQIAEAVRLHAGVSARAARERAVRALVDVGIADAGKRLGEYPHQWSGGMRQRAMIAMALSCNPRLLIADEPTTALDATVQAQVLDLLDQLRMSRRLGVLLITHDLGIVARRADWVHVMFEGRIVESSSPHELFTNAAHPYTRALLAHRPSVRHRKDRLGPPFVAGVEIETS